MAACFTSLLARFSWSGKNVSIYSSFFIASRFYRIYTATVLWFVVWFLLLNCSFNAFLLYQSWKSNRTLCEGTFPVMWSVYFATQQVFCNHMKFMISKQVPKESQIPLGLYHFFFSLSFAFAHRIYGRSFTNKIKRKCSFSEHLPLRSYHFSYDSHSATEIIDVCNESSHLTQTGVSHTNTIRSCFMILTC